MGPSLSAGLQETLSVFDVAGEPRTTPEVAEALDLGRRTAYARLERLVDADRLATKKVGANARVWWRPPADDDDVTTDVTRWEHQFRSLVEATDEYAIFLLDTEGHVRTWNSGAERIKGYEAADVVGEHFSTFYTEADREDRLPQRNLRAAVELGSVQDEGWRVRADGSRFWANVTITAIREDGDLVGFAKVTKDMTERRAREQHLREEHSLVESLLNTQPNALYAFDQDGEPIRWNDRLESVTGYAAEEIQTMQPTDFVPDRAVEEVEAAIERVFETGEHVTVEAPLLTADGDEIPYEFTGSPLRDDDDGAIVGYTGIGRDISELRARERRLQRQYDDLQSELEGVYTHIGEAFFALDEDARITHVNDKATELVGLSAGRLIGSRTWEVLPEIAEGRPRELLEDALESQSPVEFDFQSEILDTWFEIRAYPAKDGLSIHAQDITDRKTRERELEEYRRWTQTLITNFPTGAIAVVDEDLRYVTFGGTPEGRTDLSRTDIQGRLASEVLPEKLESTVVPHYEAALDGDPSEFVTTIDDRIYEFHFVPVRDDDGNVFAAMGMSTDVTEREEREQELRDRVRQQQAVTDLGQRALQNSDLDALLAEATEVVAETLDTDYCKVLELDPDAQELRLRQGVGWDDGIVGQATVSSVEDASQAAVTLTADQPIIVEDLATDSRIDGPELLTSHDVQSGISTVIGPTDDPWGILGTHDTDNREFSEQDATFVQSVANVLAAAIERHDYEQTLVYQREQLAALNSLNEVVRDISGAVIEQSTREEIERTVCERLAETDSYDFAWTGEVNPTTQRVEPQVQVGVEGYLDDVTLSVDPEDELSEGATGRALRTGEIQVTNDMAANDRYEPWRETVEAYGFRSSAAVPITHEGTTYGVLNVYTERPSAFEDQEHAVIAQLGEVVGHAIAATERKRALMSDELVELEFRIEDFLGAFSVPADSSGSISIDHAVPVDDDEFLVYGTAGESAMDTVRELAAAAPSWQELTVRGDADDDPATFEIQMTDPPVLSVVASLGGYVDTAVIDGGDLRVTIHLAPTVDARRVIDAFEDTYPNAEMQRRRQITQTGGDSKPLPAQLLGELTDRQRTAVEAAYHAGFFEWPRDASGEDVAASLGVSPPTFHQHLRKAERKLLVSLFASPSGDPEAPTGPP
jgi:PAS domain S-box-containing protein